MMPAYYNENDAEKAAVLRELIRENVIAPGEVDERSIKDVDGADLRDFIQCHFFAGFGIWSYALRLAGWPDDRPVWTGSCPCPSFSAAGKGGGFDDPRHLWPHWSPLIAKCQPPVIFGEQADGAIGYGWLDLVYVDLEKAAYSVGATVLGACSVGAPHIRQRLYFCGHAQATEVRSRHGEVRARTGEEISDRLGDSNLSSQRPNPNVRLSSDRDLQRSGEQRLLKEDGGTVRSSHASRSGTGRHAGNVSGEAKEGGREGDSDRQDFAGPHEPRSATGDSSDSTQRGLSMHGSAPGESGHFALASQPSISSFPLSQRLEGQFGDVRDWRGPGWLDPNTARSVAATGATRGFWGDCDWWHARDEKYRPIEPGLFPLATGVTNRVLKLRGYGDAIVPQVAQAFIEAYLESKY